MEKKLTWGWIYYGKLCKEHVYSSTYIIKVTTNCVEVIYTYQYDTHMPWNQLPVEQVYLEHLYETADKLFQSASWI